MTDYQSPEVPDRQPESTPPGMDSKNWMAIAALALGILSLCAWFLPICGFPIALTGVVLGILSMQSAKRTIALVGLVLCGLGLLATIANAVAGAALAITNPGWLENMLGNF